MEREERGEREEGGECVWNVGCIYIYIHNCRTTFIENIYHLVSCSCPEGRRSGYVCTWTDLHHVN